MRNRRKSRLKNLSVIHGLFLMFLTAFVLFYVFPFLISLIYSILDNPMNRAFVGLANYNTLFSNKYFLLGTKNTMLFLLICIPLNMTLSLMLATICSKLKGMGTLLSFVLLVPYAIPTATSAVVWMQFFSYNGIVNGFLHRYSLPAVDWLNSSYGMMIVVMIFLWKNVGYNLVFFITALSGVPKEQYESSDIDGANAVSKFIYITLPNIFPTLFVVFLLTFINSFRIFKEIYILTGSTPPENLYTLQHFMNNMFSSLEYGKLTSASSILTLSIVAFMIVMFHFDHKISRDLS